MHRTLISTAGTSLLRGLREAGHDVPPGEEPLLTPHDAQALASQAPRLSAELSFLACFDPDKDDQIVLLTTDTPAGRRVADAVAALARAWWGAEASVQSVAGLVLDDVQRFRREGLPTLFNTFERAVASAEEAGRTIEVGMSGGVKPVIPYITLYALLRGLRLYHVFEPQGESAPVLLPLPALPVGYDSDAIAAFLPLAERFQAEGTMPITEVRERLEQWYDRLEGFFETDGDVATLSAFGHHLLERLQPDEGAHVWLSPSARKTVSALHGIQEKVAHTFLYRLTTPLFRDLYEHEFILTDLRVAKAGSVAHRAAYWLQGGQVYVAEYYAKYYGNDLEGRMRANYEEREFDRFEVGKPMAAKPLDDMVREWDVKLEQRLEETEALLRVGDEEAAALRGAAAALKQERQQLESRIDALQGERETLQGQVQDANARAEEQTTRAEEHEQALKALTETLPPDDAGLWDRLRWAFRGGAPR